MASDQGQRGDVTERFQSALRQAITGPDTSSAELLPTMLATAAGEALGADGAGLCIVTSEHRVPIGASSPAATITERLQFTLGEGPCLDALAHRRAVRVDEDQIRGDWPAYYAQLASDTPFRSVVAVPLALTGNLRGALDLYFSSPAMAPYVTVTDATIVADQVATFLTTAGTRSAPGPRWTGLDAPAWMYGPEARNRLRVWIAVGVLMGRHNLPAPDALALLRAHAYSHNESVEQTSNSILDAAADPNDFGPLLT